MGSERVGFSELEGSRESERGTSEKKKKCPIPRDGLSDVVDHRRGLLGYGSSASYMRQGSRFGYVKVESVSEHADVIKESPVRLGSSRSDDFKLSNNCKKLNRNGSGCSKRPRLVFMEDSHGLDKDQPPKARANCGGKRSDKRTVKASTRTQFDLFSPKNCTAIINSSSGGHNVLGYYGLKPDLHDITKQVNELSIINHSLEELLDDTFLCKDLGKTTWTTTLGTNEKIVESIKSVCTILVSQRPSQIQASSELEGNLNKVMAAGISSVSCAPGSAMHDKRDSTVIEQLSQNKESFSPPESLANTVNWPLYHPSVVLERLSLQPPEDFESLLSGDARRLLSARDGFDSRLGKQLATQPYLPAFSWSHNFGGHCKSSSDALKLSASKSSCQGSKWSKIGINTCFSGVASNDFTDFTEIIFNPDLVPMGDIVSVNNKIGESGPCSGTLATTDSRIATITLDEIPLSLTVAAQTLCDLSMQSLPPELIRILRRPRKPLDKAPKVQKFKYEDRTERPFSRPKLLLGYESMVRHIDHSIPSKKTKLSSTDKKNDGSQVNGIIKGPLIWSGPKSFRSSHRPVKDTGPDNKYRSSDLSKPSIGLPPVRFLEKGSNTQQKPRKHWDR